MQRVTWPHLALLTHNTAYTQHCLHTTLPTHNTAYTWHLALSYNHIQTNNKYMHTKYTYIYTIYILLHTTHYQHLDHFKCIIFNPFFRNEPEAKKLPLPNLGRTFRVKNKEGTPLFASEINKIRGIAWNW